MVRTQPGHGWGWSAGGRFCAPDFPRAGSKRGPVGRVRVMYGDAPYESFSVSTLAERLDCPQKGVKPTGKGNPVWSLERWKAVAALVAGWYGDDRPETELVDGTVGWMDPVQREIVERLFVGWRSIYPKDPEVEVILDVPPVTWVDHQARIELRVKPTVAFVHPDGSREVVRIKSGVSLTSQAEAAVLHQGAEEGWSFVDAALEAGAAEEVAPPADPEELLKRLVAAADPSPVVSPGLYCFSCSSAPRCGAYPVIDQGRIHNSTRAVTLSRGHLGWVETCARRVAWDRVFAVPKDREGQEEVSAGLAAGRLFHEMAAAAIPADDPQAVVTAMARQTAPADAAELLRLWDNHLRLWEEDGRPRIRAVEVPVGVTMLAEGIRVDSRNREHHEPVAVTIIGALDATGRHDDETPMVIEHRTGKVGEHGHLEPEFYAVATARFVESQTGSMPERVAVHLHHLRPDTPECSVRMFDRTDIHGAENRLRVVAGLVAGWHPLQTLQPSYLVGDWCGSCRFQSTCRRFRD